MDEKLLDSICNDKSFLESILKLDNDEDIRKAFLEKGLEMSIEDVKIFKNAVVSTVNNDHEVPDSALDEISGGVDMHKVVLAVCGIAATGAAVWGVKTLVDKASGMLDQGRSTMKKMDKTMDNINGLVDKTSPVVDNVGNAAQGVAGVAHKIEERGILRTTLGWQ